MSPAHCPPAGVLLINLGSPAAPSTGAVSRYLREFLSDEKVIDINPLGRWLLVNLIIAPFRAPKSAAAYRKIWGERGSPLLAHSHDLRDGVSAALASDNVVVKLAMRYGEPSIEAGLSALREAGCERIVVVPLYPQYATSSFGTAVDEVYRVARKRWDPDHIVVTPPFYDDPGFIGAFAAVGKASMPDLDPDHVLFSFHGLPQRHIRKSVPNSPTCLRTQSCCDNIRPDNMNCYRAQCFATARALAAALSLDESGYTVSFQSRLGRDPWLLPNTEDVLPALAAAGVRRLAVFCPAFVADCLETLEEIELRGRALFLDAGGDELALIPSLNASPVWVDALTRHIRSQGLPSRIA